MNPEEQAAMAAQGGGQAGGGQADPAQMIAENNQMLREIGQMLQQLMQLIQQAAGGGAAEPDGDEALRQQAVARLQGQ